jgi:ATP-dependent DNA helicase RecQ
LKITIDREQLYKFQVANRQYDPFIKLLLRTYTGLFSDYIKIDEDRLCMLASLPLSQVKKYFEILSKAGILAYYPAKTTPMIIYTNERVDTSRLIINTKEYLLRKKRSTARVESMIQYATGTTKCRSLFFLEYFGEIQATRCGNCDVCRKRNQVNLSKYEFDVILNEIKEILQANPQTLVDLVSKIQHPEDATCKVIQYLVDSGKIIEHGGNLRWHNY